MRQFTETSKFVRTTHRMNDYCQEIRGKMNKKSIPHSLEICRLCGVYDYLDIDIQEESSLTGPDFRDKVFKCSGVWVSKSDKLTTKLCLRCFEEIKRIDLFRSFCAATNNEIRLEFSLRNVDDDTSSDELVDDGDEMEHHQTNSGEDDSDTQNEQGTREVERRQSSVTLRPMDVDHLIAPVVNHRDNREQDAPRVNNSTPSIAQNDGILCICLSDDDETEHSDVETVAFKSNEGQKKNVTVKGKTKIKRKPTKTDERHRFTIRCGEKKKCFGAFESVDAMQYHVENYHAKIAERKFSCHLCKRQFARNASLRHHMGLIHRGIRSFKCSFSDCSKAYDHIYKLKSHMNAMHTHKKSFDCTICCEKFYTTQNLGTHLACKHGIGNRYYCYLCRRTLCNKQTLRMHFNKRHMGQSRFKCNVTDCRKLFVSKGGLDQHMNAIHTQAKSSDCPICKKSFLYRCNLVQHLAYKHGRGKQYCCHLCKKPMSKKQSLQIHFNIQHIGQSRFKCNVENCSVLCGSKKHLELHMNAVHTQEVTFNCSICKFITYSRYALRMHVMRRHGI